MSTLDKIFLTLELRKAALQAYEKAGKAAGGINAPVASSMPDEAPSQRSGNPLSGAHMFYRTGRHKPFSN